MYLPEEVILRVNKIEGDTVFMGPKYRCLRFLWSGKKGYPFIIDHVENEQGLFKKGETMKFNGEIMHFHPSRPDRLLGFNQSGELWAVVGNIEFSNTRPIGGWVRLYGDDSATITTIESNEIGTIKVRKGFSVQKSIIETVVEERIFVAYYNDPKERANVRYEFKLSNPCEDPMMRKYIETHTDELIYMLPGGGITFMYNPDDNRTVGYITRIE